MRRSAAAVRALLCALLLPGGCGRPADAPVLDLPARPAGAPGGEDIARTLRSLDFQEREERIHAEVARGNVPGWLRTLRPVEITGTVDGREHRVIFWATPDYLAVGSDDDYFLTPLSLRTARRIARRAGATLPTPAMVDAIWAAAEFHLIPIRLRLEESMRTVPDFIRHDALVKAQRQVHHAPAGAFIAGHKLDVVRAPGAVADPAGVALYGWHFPDGRIIQPLFTALTTDWVMFSHGVRLVHRTVLADGTHRDLEDVLDDAALAPLLLGDAAR